MEQKYLQQGVTQAAQGNYKAAIDFFNQAIAVNLECPEAYYQRGLAYDKIAKSEQAIADYNQSLNLDA